MAEGAGTFLLVAIGPGAMMLDARSPGAVGAIGIAVAFGVAVALAIWLFGDVSGAHINPAGTVGLAAAGHFRREDAAAYVGAQLVGAVVAACLLRAVLGPVGHLGATLPAAGIGASVVLECLMSFALMSAVLCVVVQGWDRWVGGLVIGAVVGLCAYFGGAYTGASMNPARSFGPAVAGGEWSGHWIYWVAPIAGMLGAAVLGRSLFSAPPAPSHSSRVPPAGAPAAVRVGDRGRDDLVAPTGPAPAGALRRPEG
ncbi:MAG: MIP/aquaporin family protein [Gemmatimonadales bacterium]